MINAYFKRYDALGRKGKKYKFVKVLLQVRACLRFNVKTVKSHRLVSFEQSLSPVLNIHFKCLVILLFHK